MILRRFKTYILTMSQPKIVKLLCGLSCYQRAIVSRASGHLGVCHAALKQTLDPFFPRDDPPAFQLALAHEAPVAPWLKEHKERNSDPLGPLASLLEPILWGVPKKGRTPYTVRRRWFAFTPGSKRARFGMPLLNVTHCLECNNLTLPNCVCPHCYSKVRERTNELKAKLSDDFKFRHPLKEIKFVYDNEHFGTENSKHVVKMEGERPSWFAKAVLPRKGA